MRFLSVVAVVSLTTSSALAAEGDAEHVEPAPTAELADASTDRVTAVMGTPAIGGLSIDGRSISSPTVVAALEYGHLFTRHFELGLGFQAQHPFDASVSAYRPYAMARAFFPLRSAEIGLSLRAGPTWFHFGEQTLGSIAPSAAIDGRYWISDRFGIVGAIELLASGVHVDDSNTQIWNVAAIASLGVTMRL